MDTLAPIISLGLFGGGTVAIWFLNAKTKHYNLFINIVFGVVGFALYLLGLYLVWASIPSSLERSLLRLMPDALFSILEWALAMAFSCLFLLFIPRYKRSNSSRSRSKVVSHF